MASSHSYSRLCNGYSGSESQMFEMVKSRSESQMFEMVKSRIQSFFFFLVFFLSKHLNGISK